MSEHEKSISDAGRDGPFIYTQEGPFNYFTDDLSGVSVRQIGRSLSRTVRYRGMTPHPYTVAQHCIFGARFIEQASEDNLRLIGMDVDRPDYKWYRAVLLFLLHDAPEAYVGDIPNPLKRSLTVRPPWSREPADLMTVQELENEINARIAQALDIDLPSPEEIRDIKALDQALFMWEFWVLYGLQPLLDVMSTGFGVGDPDMTLSIVKAIDEVSWPGAEKLYSEDLNRTEDAWVGWVNTLVLYERHMRGNDTLNDT